jgi:IS605 OrfB family transposase
MRHLRPYLNDGIISFVTIIRHESALFSACTLHTMITRTIKLKIYPDDYAWLDGAAREVNQVFNYCNEVSAKQASYYRLGSPRRRLSGVDLCSLTSGYTEFCEFIGADTIQKICIEYAAKRAAAGKSRLHWRVSDPSSPKRSLGWVPFKALSLSLMATSVQFCGKRFRVFELERIKALPVPEAKRTRPWKDSCFAQDACSDWYLCLVVQQETEVTAAKKEEAGIDLGLKDLAVASDGWRIPAPQFYRRAQEKLAELQRPRGTRKQGKRSRRSKRLARAHRKVRRQRLDFTHKASAKTVKRYGKVVMGDVSSTRLAQTRMAKSVNDAAWSLYRGQILYKSRQAGTNAIIVNERCSTRECSDCGSQSGPKGLDGLSVREWTCSDCGARHDRDVNSAKICLARGNAPVL